MYVDVIDLKIETEEKEKRIIQKLADCDSHQDKNFMKKGSAISPFIKFFRDKKIIKAEQNF